jgi:uncharacterized protein (DUF427 family)
MKAVWNGVTVAESDETVVVEGNHYFPISSVREDLLRPSEQHTTCAWKGQASYYSVEVDGQLNEAAAWFYPDPKPEAAQIQGHVAFWKGVEVTT